MITINEKPGGSSVDVSKLWRSMKGGRSVVVFSIKLASSSSQTSTVTSEREGRMVESSSVSSPLGSGSRGGRGGGEIGADLLDELSSCHLLATRHFSHQPSLGVIGSHSLLPEVAVRPPIGLPLTAL